MLDMRLRLVLVIAMVISAALIIRISSKAKMEIKDATNWLLVCCAMLLAAIFPDILAWLSRLAGISLASNAAFALLIFLLLCIVYYLNIRISRLAIQNRKLIQRLALFERALRESQASATNPVKE
jgi:hypothetical protein